MQPPSGRDGDREWLTKIAPTISILMPEVSVIEPTERSWLSRPDPGIVIGAADNDPSGIGTYSQTGAQFGFTGLWTLLLSYPSWS